MLLDMSEILNGRYRRLTIAFAKRVVALLYKYVGASYLERRVRSSGTT